MTDKRPIEYPLAEEVARAIVAAARLEGEDPIAVAKGRARSRARVYVFVALAHRFPTVKYTPLMRLCGAKPESAFSAAVAAAQTARGDATKNGDWFSLDALNQVVEACGWPAMTAIDAELRRMAQKPRETVVDVPAIIPAPSFEGAKPDIEPVAEAPAQPGPDLDPCQPVAPATVLQNITENITAPAKVSDAARALATFQRARVERKPTAKPGPEPRRATFANAAAIELNYRPDRPAARRSVDVVTYEFFGDPAPHRSALAQKMEGGKA